MIIPEHKYRDILKHLPILCVDIAIKIDGGYLLVKRKNEPKKDKWWVPGGRLHKGETAEEAARRKVKEETGLDIKGIMPIGYYECVFRKSSFGEILGGYHALSIVFLCRADKGEVLLDKQSSGWKIGKLPGDFKIRNFSEGRGIWQKSRKH